MTDTSYHIAIWIGISIGKIFSSILGIESIEKNGIGPSLKLIYEFAIIHNILILMVNADGICIKMFIYKALLFIKLTLCFTVFAIISSASIKKAFYKKYESINTYVI